MNKETGALIRLGTASASAGLVVLSLLPAAGIALPTFTDVAGEAGVLYRQHTPNELGECLVIAGSFCEPERMSGGVAVGDVDGDGLPDLFVTRLEGVDALFRNLGNGTFADITAGSGLGAHDTQSNGAAFADIDNDGDLDLYLSTIGEDEEVNNRNYLYVNDGRGRFSEEAVARGADSPNILGARAVYSIAVGDYDRDGWVDLHTSEWWVTFRSNSRLLRNHGAAAPGTFHDATSAAGVELDTSSAFASAFTDLDNDGWPDFAVAGDFGTSRLFWNDGDGTFTGRTKESGVGTDENGMGSTFGDFDGDGDLDWFVTSIYDPDETCEQGSCGWAYSGNRLYRNEGNRFFTDATDAAGVRDGAWGWGAAFFDYDNDGALDLVMTNGVDFPGTDIELAFNTDPMRLWHNDGTGVMTERAAESGVKDTGSGKGLAVFDYDGDGDLDIFVVNNGWAPRLYRNDGGNDNGWLRVRAVGSVSNREGVGARITLQLDPGGRPQVREIGTSTHFLGQSERVAHFGIGDPSREVVHRVRIRWPSGRVQDYYDVAANGTLIATEPEVRCGPRQDPIGYCYTE